MHWKHKDTILFLERLELYIAAGVNLQRALAIAEENLSSRHRRAIAELRSKVESGQTLSSGLSKYIGLAPTLSGLIQHGESSGNLAQALGFARTLLERQDELTKKCLSALTYPLVIGLFALLLTIGLIRGVMPQIIPMLKSLHVPLPFLTRSVMSISDFLVAYGLVTVSGLITGICLALFLYKKIKIIRSGVQHTMLYVPIVGYIMKTYAGSVFLRSCGALITSGIPLGQAYSKTVSALSFIPFRSGLTPGMSQISKGISIGTILSAKSTRIPAYAASLISAGEASGSLGDSMTRAAHILDRELEHSLKRMTALIEPIMMAGMGCVVGSIALSIMMPIYDISRVLQH